MTGLELDFIVKDSLEALVLYKKIFDLEVIEATSFPKGENEVVFSIFDTRLHMLDENESFSMYAPKEGEGTPFWFNVMVENIEETFKKVEENNLEILQPLIKMESYGVSNAMFKDPFGYIWMLHEVHEVVSFDDRVKVWEEKRDN